MDQRLTVQTHDDLLNQLKKLWNDQEKAALLFDENGLTRAEGMIADITGTEKDRIVKLADGKDIKLHSIVAVNGIFMADYSEC